MSTDDFPIASAAARKLAEHDLAVLNAAEPPSFRLNRTQLRLEVALRNGLGQREAERLQALDLPQTLTGRVRHLVRRYRAWALARGGLRASAVAFAGLCAVGLCIGLGLTLWNAGRPLVVKLEASAQAYHHVLEDGSVIKLEPGAVGTLSIVEQDVRFELQRGLAEFDVVHGPKRRWDVAASGYLVSVLGTQFAVRYEPSDEFEVSVQRGAVAVRLPGQESVLKLLPGDALSAKPGEVTLRHGPEASGEASTQQASTPAAEPAANGTSAEAAALDATQAKLSSAKSGASKSSSSAALAGNRIASQGEDRARRDSNERRLLAQARQALVDGEHRSALKAVELHARRYPDGQLVEEREALRIEALRGLGRQRAAQSAAGQFRQRFPKSVLAPQMPASVPQGQDVERSANKP